MAVAPALGRRTRVLCFCPVCPDCVLSVGSARSARSVGSCLESWGCEAGCVAVIPPFTTFSSLLCDLRDRKLQHHASTSLRGPSRSLFSTSSLLYTFHTALPYCDLRITQTRLHDRDACTIRVSTWTQFNHACLCQARVVVLYCSGRLRPDVRGAEYSYGALRGSPVVRNAH